MKEIRKTALMESVNRLCLRVVEIRVWVKEFAFVLHEHKILACLGYDFEVPRIWTWDYYVSCAH